MKEKQVLREGLLVENADGAWLVAQRCPNCGQIQYPQKKRCTRCLNTEMEELLIGHSGKVFSFTTTFMPVSGFTPPLTCGYVVTEEGARVFAPFDAEDTEKIRIGMDVELVTADLWETDDEIITGYKYRIREEEAK